MVIDWPSGAHDRSPLQFERTGHDASAGPVNIGDVQRCLSVSSCRERDAPAVAGHGGAPDDPRPGRAPQFGGDLTLELPDAVAVPFGRDIEEVTGAQPRRRSASGGQRDAARCRRSGSSCR